MHNEPSVIYQAGKIRQRDVILQDVARAHAIERVGRIYGSSGGALVALFHAIKLSGWAAHALDDLEGYLRSGHRLWAINWWAPLYGLKTLNPLKRWLVRRLRAYHRRGANLRVGDLKVPLYLVASDRDGFPVFFGREDPSLHHVYHNATVRTEDALIIEACIAALSTRVQFDAVPVNGAYYADLRPAIADLTATVLDMEAAAPRPIKAADPIVPMLRMAPNTLTQGFHMHRWYERNQAILTQQYADLLAHTRRLEAALGAPDPAAPEVGHVRVQYLTSTNMFEDTRIAATEKERFFALAEEVGAPQLDTFDLTQPFDMFYGAGGLSAVLIELGLAREIERRGATGKVRTVAGCSAGVLIGLYHAAMLGAQQHPQHYTPEAAHALRHLEELITGLQPTDMFDLNLTQPQQLVRGLVRPGPFFDRMVADLERWTGAPDGREVTFEDIRLPLIVATTRGSDGAPALFGMPDGRETRFGEVVVKPMNAPIIQAVEAGMALPLYVPPVQIGDDEYLDGGTSMFDHAHLLAMMEPEPLNLLCLHMGEPLGYSFGYPARPDLLRATYDTHSYIIPEMRRRVYETVNLFYRYLGLRKRALALMAEDPALDLPEPTERWWHTWDLTAGR